MRDVSERRRLKEDLRQKELQLIQKNRMAVLGLLVSGVAHDISNQNDVILKSSGRVAGGGGGLPRLVGFPKEAGLATTPPWVPHPANEGRPPPRSRRNP